MLKKGTKTIAFIFLTGLVGLLLYVGIILIGDYVIDEKKLVMNSSSKLVDESGQEIAKLYVENRQLVSIQDIPVHVQQAFIAIEDSRFYQHSGIDVKAIGRAIYKDLLQGGKVEGGSTITQQLVKNIFLSSEKTLLRKTKEAVIAINLERTYSKEKLLEYYLNNIYFGHGVYGIEAAANYYFSKNVFELSVVEGALLAALPKAPSHYSPILHPEKALARRNLVLSIMEKHDYLEPEQAVRLQGKTLQLNVKEQVKNIAFRSYIDLVLEEAKSKYHLSNEEIARGGYTIVVPMDRNVQQKSYNYFQNDSKFPGVDNNVEGSFVLLDKKTGGVKAALGGRKYVAKGLNRVTVKRQPGSTFKPLVVYSPALEVMSYHPYSLLKDKKISYNGYVPKNFDDQYDNQKTMYDAIVRSDNAPAVWLLNEIGVDVGKEFAKKYGLPIEAQDNLSMALGGITKGVTPLDLAKAYSAFANDGEMVEPYFITAIYDRNGKLLNEVKVKKRKVISKQTAWYMTKMLQAVVKHGTGKHGQYAGALAGKTGSTQNPHKQNTIKDAWFAGYNTEVVGALWMGYDRTDDKQYLAGGSKHATVLFKEILSTMDVQTETFHRPIGVKDLEPPVRLHEITDLNGRLTFNGFGLLSVKLTWTPSSDERIEYKVMEVENYQPKHITTVVGEGEYTVSNVNIFGNVKYFVVPVNPQTLLEGRKSNIVTFSFFGQK